uniref:Heat shock factor binding protein 1 n=1 Tax=Globisporangium ultimum (strain ATCC 200006 / CBS 805.95 / DAOM BR144) TaxID=431595 RepID=K3WFM2_GLOUD
MVSRACVSSSSDASKNAANNAPALDEMGSRIDDLEKSIADLMEQTNEDGGDKSADPATAGNSASKEKGELV